MNYFDTIADYNKHYVSFLRKKEQKFITQFIRPNPVKGVGLEVGCGNGFYSKILKDKFFNHDFTHSDYSHVMIEIAKENSINNGYNKGIFVVDDFKNTKLIEQKYDTIVCLGAVEFIGDQFFINSHKMLSSRGKVILCLPKNNIYGFFYKYFYKKKGIELYFYNKDVEKFIMSLFYIEKQKNCGLNTYLVLRKK